MITDKATSQISLLINNLATGVTTTKDFLDAVVHQQVESTLVLPESILSNTETSKVIAKTAENISDMSASKIRPSMWNGQCHQPPLYHPVILYILHHWYTPPFQHLNRNTTMHASSSQAAADQARLSGQERPHSGQICPNSGLS